MIMRHLLVSTRRGRRDMYCMHIRLETDTKYVCGLTRPTLQTPDRLRLPPTRDTTLDVEMSVSTVI